MIGFSAELANGHKIVFHPNTPIKSILKGPLFLEEPEVSSRTFAVKIPTQPNAIGFEFVHKLGKRTTTETFDSKLYLFGSFWKNAKAQILDYNEDEINVRFMIDRGYYADFGQRSLRSFNYEEPYKFRYYKQQLSASEYQLNNLGVSGNVTITFTFQTTDNPTPIVIPFTYLHGSETTAAFIQRIVTYFNDRIYTYRYLFEVNPLFPLLFNIYNLTFSTSAPNFFFSVASDSASLTITNTGSNTSMSPLQSREVFYDQALLNANRDCVCFPVAAPDMYIDTEQNPNYLGILNMYKPKIIGNALYPGKFYGESQPLSPFPLVKYVLYKTHTETGITIAIDDFFNAELDQLVMFNHEDIRNTIRLPKNSWKYMDAGVFFYNDIVPDINISKLVNDFRYLFNTLVDYNSRSNSIRIIRLQTILESNKEVDWTNKVIDNYNLEVEEKNYGLDYEWTGEPLATELLPEIEEPTTADEEPTVSALPVAPVSGYIITKVTASNKYFRWNWNGSGWQQYAEDLYPYIPENQNAQLKTGISPLFTVQYPWAFVAPTLPYNVKWLLPYTKQSGNLNVTDKVEAPHRYMIYRGIKECDVYPTSGDVTPQTGYYPFGSSHNYDYRGNKVGNYSLAWNAEDGLHNTLWSKWLAFMRNSRPIRFKFTLTPEDLLSFDHLTKVRVGNQRHFVDELEFETKEDRTIIAMGKLYVIK